MTDGLAEILIADNCNFDDLILLVSLDLKKNHGRCLPKGGGGVCDHVILKENQLAIILLRKCDC